MPITKVYKIIFSNGDKCFTSKGEEYAKAYEYGCNAKIEVASQVNRRFIDKPNAPSWKHANGTEVLIKSHEWQPITFK